MPSLKIVNAGVDFFFLLQRMMDVPHWLGKKIIMVHCLCLWKGISHSLIFIHEENKIHSEVLTLWIKSGNFLMRNLANILILQKTISKKIILQSMFRVFDFSMFILLTHYYIKVYISYSMLLHYTKAIAEHRF